MIKSTIQTAASLSIGYKNTETQTILEWKSRECDINLSNTITGIEITTQKDTKKSELLIKIKNDKGIKDYLCSYDSKSALTV